VMPFSGLVKVTFAFATRAPDGSETDPESEALEARVCASATGVTVMVAKAITANRGSDRARSVGIDGGPSREKFFV
jgi:hypothetical protein